MCLLFRSVPCLPAWPMLVRAVLVNLNYTGVSSFSRELLQVGRLGPHVLTVLVQRQQDDAGERPES